MQSFDTFLALDASTEMCSVALHVQGEVVFKDCSIPKSHAKVLLPIIEELLREKDVSISDLDAIVVARGPGSFTGIRICLSVAQSLAYALQIPLLGVDSLSCLAKTAIAIHGAQSAIVITALDARMREVYWAAYRVEESTLTTLFAPQLESAASFVNTLAEHIGLEEKILAVGHGFSADINKDQLSSFQNMQLDETLLPHARGAVSLILGGQASNTQTSDIQTSNTHTNDTQVSDLSKNYQIEPLYLRNEVTWEKRKRIRQTNL